MHGLECLKLAKISLRGNAHGLGVNTILRAVITTTVVDAVLIPIGLELVLFLCIFA